MDTNGHIARRLYKSRRNKVIDGVCGGISEYFDVDPTIVRLLWVLVTFMGGSGFILYIIGMIIMPVNPEHLATPQPSSATGGSSPDKKRFFGVLLILIGAFILMMNMGWFWGFRWWSFSRTVMLPVLLILIGALFVYIHTAKRNGPPGQAANIPPGAIPPEDVSPQPRVIKELRRCKTNRKLFGVCCGIAKYFDIDPTIVRFIIVALVLMSLGWGLLIYIILGIVMPEEKLTPKIL